MKRRLRFKKRYKEELRKGKYLMEIANLADVTPTTVRNWIDSDNLKLYSYPIVRNISVFFNVKIDELFE